MYIVDMAARRHGQELWESLDVMIEIIDQQQMKQIADRDFRKNLVSTFENVLELLGNLHNRLNKIEDFLQQNFK